MFEWTPIQEEDSGSAFSMKPIIELVFEYQTQLKDFVLQYIGRNVILEQWDLIAEPLPFADRIGRIERNLRALVGTDITAGMIKTVDWHGELKDDRRLDFTDVNRWFEIINLMYKLIIILQQRYMVTGTFYTGQNPDFQILGIG
jgi:hypothetical protein